MCVCGALHFGSDTFFGCNCCVSDNFLLPVPVLDVYKYVYIILIIIVAPPLRQRSGQRSSPEKVEDSCSLGNTES